MDLPQNRLLGERHRASNTMHRLWRDYRPFVDIKVNHCIHREILNLLVEVNVAEIVQGRMKSIILLRISVGYPLV